MSRIEHIEAWLTRHCLLAALCAGAVVRAISALVGIGFHARDDYFHVLAPALGWLRDPHFDWGTSELPGAGLRSELVPRIVEGLVSFYGHLGISEPESVLRALHATFGAYSLLAIIGTYLLSERVAADSRVTRIATWLAALHFAMPYLGTRLLIEALAMPPVLFGLYFATFRSFRQTFIAGALLGAACWLRYQVAVIAVTTALVLAIDKRFRDIAALALGGIAALVLQGVFDWLMVGQPFLPLIRNIAYNAHPPADLTHSSFWTYLVVWLVLTVPPATLVLVPSMWRASKTWLIIWMPFVLFVIAHSIIPHKEERFMAPVLPLFLILVAGGLARKIMTAMAVWFVAVHVLALGLTVTHQSQAGQRHALAALRRDKDAKAIISMGPEIPAFYLGERALPVARLGEVDAVWLRRTMRTLDDQGTPANRFVAYVADAFKVTLLLEAMELDCASHEVYQGAPLDALAYRLNPEHNRRRSPIVVWSCERPDVALNTPRNR